MSSVNKSILVGHLGAAPDVHYFADGTPKASVSIATTDSWKDKESGEKKEKTEWHRVVFFKGLAEIVAKHLQKGSQIYVEGKLRTRKWTDKDGIERYITEIVGEEMRMLGKKPAGEMQNAPAPSKAASGFDDMDDDIPF